MSMAPRDIRELFPEHDHIFALREYRTRVLAHRLKKFGFEKQVNSLSPNEQLLLAYFMEGHQRVALVNEAYERLGVACRMAVR